jgi:hypothetical protein
MLIASDHRVSNDTFVFTKLIVVGVFSDDIYANIYNNSKELNGEQEVYLKQLHARCLTYQITTKHRKERMSSSAILGFKLL